MAYPPYTEWMKQRNQIYPLPFPEEDLLYPLEPEQPTSVSLEKYIILHTTNQELLAEIEEGIFLSHRY